MSSATPTPVLPPYYVDPVPLAAARHGSWRLIAGNAGFAAATPAIPAIPSEFPALSRSYPILFTAGEAAPVALCGLERENLFIDEGQWATGAYVPAYVRRYPFLLVQAADKSGFGLAVDSASGLLAKEGSVGEALFEKGEPAPVTLRALEFCRMFNDDYERGRQFCAALAEEGLLVERQAEVTLPQGRKLGVSGFRVVDPQRFAALRDDKVVAWHRNGWLAMIHYHLASLDRFTELLSRQGKRDAEAATPAAAGAVNPGQAVPAARTLQ